MTYVLGVIVGVLLAAQAPGDYQALLSLYHEFIEFRKPPMVDGVPDHTAATKERQRQRLEAFQERLTDLTPRDWPVAQRVDYLLVRSQLDAMDFELRVVRPWARDPGFYVDQLRSLPYTELPLAEAARGPFLEKLNAVPRIVEQARANLTGQASGTLARLALRQLERHDGVGQGEPRRAVPPEGVIGWYRDLAARTQEHHGELVAAVNTALQAVEGFRDWLRENEPRMKAPAWIGLENYNSYLRNVRLMPYTVDDLRLLGEREMQRASVFLKIEQNRNRGLPELQPAASREAYEQAVREAEQQIRAHLRERRLLTLPENLGAFETDAFWADRPGGKRHFWEELQYRDPLNNHIHASIPGHRFDMLLQRGKSHPIRGTIRDGARIEGWAFYIEEMLLQSGLLDRRPRARELFYIAQLARGVRIPTELKMQSGETSFEQAVRFMVEQVPFMEEDLARYDLEIYLRQPAYGMNYVMGRIQLEELLAERAAQQGAAFQLGRFHDEFLAAGLIPISLIRWEMTGNDAGVKGLWRQRNEYP